MAELGAEVVELLIGAQFGVDAQRAGHVVAVGTAPARAKAGRGIKRADAEFVQVGHDVAAIQEPEIFVELDPVGRDRNPGGFHGRAFAARKLVVT